MCVPVAWRKSAELSRSVSGLVVFGALFIQFRACHLCEFYTHFWELVLRFTSYNNNLNYRFYYIYIITFV